MIDVGATRKSNPQTGSQSPPAKPWQDKASARVSSSVSSSVSARVSARASAGLQLGFCLLPVSDLLARQLGPVFGGNPLGLHLLQLALPDGLQEKTTGNVSGKNQQDEGQKFGGGDGIGVGVWLTREPGLSFSFS